MTWQLNPFAAPLVIGGLLILPIILTVYQRNTGIAARWFVAFTIVAMGQILSYAIELSAADLPTIMLILKVEYVFLLALPLTYLFFVLAYTQRYRWLMKRRIILISAVPLIQLFLSWTNNYHYLNWEKVGTITVDGHVFFDRTPGIGSIVGSVYLYTLLGVAVFMFVSEALRQRNQYRGQVIPLVIGTILPWAGSVLHILGISPFPYLDLIPFGTILAIPVIAISLYRYNLFDLLPAAYDRVIKSLSDAVIILDTSNRIIDLNPAAEELLGVSPKTMIGQTAVRFIPRQLFDQWGNTWETHTEITVQGDDHLMYLDMRISPLLTQSGHRSGRVVLLRDITAAKKAQMQLQEMVIKDPLTGILNRRHFFELADKSFAQCQRYERSLCAAMIDLDNFKRLNDTYGHATGDHVLQFIAQFLEANIRDVDILGRYGGEEFAIVFPETNVQAAFYVAERLRTALRDIPLPIHGETMALTISIGIAAFEPGIQSTYELIDKADQALYQAKHSGRNQTAVYGHDVGVEAINLSSSLHDS